MSHARAAFRIRDLITIVWTLALAVVGLVAIAEPAEPAALPWRFKTVNSQFQVSGDQQVDHTVTCPEGYRPIAGGITNGNVYVRRTFEYTTPAERTYTIGVWHGDPNAGATTIKVSLTCVWAANLGEIQYVSNSYPNASTGRGGGTLSCPVGTRILTGGAQWTSGSFAWIGYSTPVLDDGGVGAGWYAAGISEDVDDELFIEAYCLAGSDLDTSYATVNISGQSPDYDATMGTTAQCDVGYRALLGGAYPWNSSSPTSDHGYAYIHGPISAREWRADAILPYQAQVSSVAICVPASVPSVEFTQTPPDLSNSASPSFAWSSSDQAGEDLTAECERDGIKFGCAPSGSLGYVVSEDGYHYLKVKVTNQSGQTDTAVYEWVVDTTEPTVANRLPSSNVGVTEPMRITFSEPVGGIASSVEVHAQEANVDVAGTIKRLAPDRMSWTPNRPLVPGETYRVSLNDNIHDVAGNDLIPTFWDIRAARTVQNNSAALVETWDVDDRGLASNGKVIANRMLGSAAAFKFPATAGQTVSVYGLRMPNGGSADIYVDGVKKATRSFYAGTATRAKIYESPALTAGNHSIAIRPTGTHPSGSSGNWVNVDNLTIGAAVRQEQALKHSFTPVASANAAGGSYDVVTHATDSDAAPSYFTRFVGSGVKVYATRTPSSGRVEVYVDGALRQTVNLRATSTVYKALVFSMGLPNAQHTIRLRPAGTAGGTGSAVGIDYLTVS